MLSDLTKQISKDYDVLIENAGISLRGTFIIDKNGIIRQKTVNDLPIGRSIDETLRLIKALQFFENHGEGKLMRFSRNIIYNLSILFSFLGLQFVQLIGTRKRMPILSSRMLKDPRNTSTREAKSIYSFTGLNLVIITKRFYFPSSK